MSNHLFILRPSGWVGEGKIQLNMMEEELGYSTRWSITEKDSNGQIACLQEIQVKGISDVMQNQFLFFDLGSKNFSIELDNPSIGKILGKGVLTDQLIAWEFRLASKEFEGVEVYERQSDDSYLMYAEYATADQLRTIIRGKVWQDLLPPLKE